MLPATVKDHTSLLTVNTKELPIYRDSLVPGVDVQPLFLDPNNGVWCVRVIFQRGVQLPTHYHTGTVHLWTLSGCWHYREHPDQPQTAGSYLYEPGGSIHTFFVPEDNTEPTETLMLVSGANVNFDANGQYHSVLDANSILVLVDHLVKERGLEPAKYIRAGFPTFTTEK